MEHFPYITLPKMQHFISIFSLCRETDELAAVVEFLGAKSEVNPKEIALKKREEMKKKGEIKSPGKKKGKKGEKYMYIVQWRGMRAKAWGSTPGWEGYGKLRGGEGGAQESQRDARQQRSNLSQAVASGKSMGDKQAVNFDPNSFVLLSINDFVIALDNIIISCLCVCLFVFSY